MIIILRIIIIIIIIIVIIIIIIFCIYLFVQRTSSVAERSQVPKPKVAARTSKAESRHESSSHDHTDSNSKQA